jgi:hypothetical protein
MSAIRRLNREDAIRFKRTHRRISGCSRHETRKRLEGPDLLIDSERSGNELHMENGGE